MEECNEICAANMNVIDGECSWSQPKSTQTFIFVFIITGF